MTKLNYLSLLTAIRKCCTTPYYLIGVYVKSQACCHDVFKEAIECITEDPDESQALCNSAKSRTGSNIIEFKNGSVIRILSPSGNTRGHRFHEVYYDPDLEAMIDARTKMDVLCHLRVLERPYDSENLNIAKKEREPEIC